VFLLQKTLIQCALELVSWLAAHNCMAP